MTSTLNAAFSRFIDRDDGDVQVCCPDELGCDGEFTLAQVRQKVARFASSFQAAGVKPEARVMLSGSTGIMFLAAFWAVQRLGAVCIPFAPIERGLRRHTSLEHVERLASVATPVLIVVDDMSLIEEGSRLPFSDYRSLLLLDDGVVPDIYDQNEHDIAIIQFTSGSTSVPRGCLLSHRAIMHNVAQICIRLDVSPGDDAVCWLPLFHDMGLMSGIIAPVFSHCRIRLRSPARFIMNPLLWLKDLSAGGPAHTAAPNFALALVVQALKRRPSPTLDLSKVKSLVCGSELVDPNVARIAFDTLATYGFPTSAFQPAYGMAECVLMVTSRPGGLVTGYLPVDAQLADGTPCSSTHRIDPVEIVNLGRPVAGTKIKIIGRDGQESPPGSIGQISISSDSMMTGQVPFEPNDASWSSGWLLTSDLGIMKDGELFVVGRSDDMILIRGKNLHPTAIERPVADAIGCDPSRVAVTTTGRQGDGDTLVLVIETRRRATDALATRAGAACAVSGGIEAKRVYLVAPGYLPRTTSGKLRRNELRRIVREWTKSIPEHASST